MFSRVLVVIALVAVCGLIGCEGDKDVGAPLKTQVAPTFTSVGASRIAEDSPTPPAVTGTAIMSSTSAPATSTPTAAIPSPTPTTSPSPTPTATVSPYADITCKGDMVRISLPSTLGIKGASHIRIIDDQTIEIQGWGDLDRESLVNTPPDRLSSPVLDYLDQYRTVVATLPDLRIVSTHNSLPVESEEQRFCSENDCFVFLLDHAPDADIQLLHVVEDGPNRGYWLASDRNQFHIASGYVFSGRWQWLDNNGIWLEHPGPTYGNRSYIVFYDELNDTFVDRDFAFEGHPEHVVVVRSDRAFEVTEIPYYAFQPESDGQDNTATLNEYDFSQSLLEPARQRVSPSISDMAWDEAMDGLLLMHTNPSGALFYDPTGEPRLFVPVETFLAELDFVYWRHPFDAFAISPDNSLVLFETSSEFDLISCEK